MASPAGTPSQEALALARALSRIFGWSYFIFWSVSFYPQPLTNWRRRSTVGAAIGFPFLNICGMLSYSISNMAFFLSPAIQQQYAARNHGLQPTVRANDVAYALHGLVLVILTYSQFYKSLWGLAVDPAMRTATYVRLSCLASIVAVLVCVVVVAVKGHGGYDPSTWAWLDVIYCISYIKLLLTAVKYVPQAYENFRRKSTVGWSISQVTLDFAGSMLSLLQLFLDSALDGDWSGVTGNPAKFFLANISIFFDVVFFVQHYGLYKQRFDEALEHDVPEPAAVASNNIVQKGRGSRRNGQATGNGTARNIRVAGGTEREPLLSRRSDSGRSPR